MPMVTEWLCLTKSTLQWRERRLRSVTRVCKTSVYVEPNSRLQWRVIYRTAPEQQLFQLVSITAHDYRRP